MDAYATPSGDLEVGQYVEQPDGTYITHIAASTYKDATSTTPWPDRFVVTQQAPYSTELPTN